MGNLTSKRVEKLIRQGIPRNHYDGRGLRLEIRGPKAASWSARYQINHVERWVGLGSARTFGLAEVRERNRKIVRQLLADKKDPLALRQAERSAQAAAARKAITFAAAARAFITDNSRKWGNPKHAAQWTSTIAAYVNPVVGELAVSDIDVTHILQVLEQPLAARPPQLAGSFWATRPETASRVRARIEAILDYASARQYRSGDNPAALKVIGKVLPARGSAAHHPALPFAELPAFMAALAAREGVPTRALEFAILTAARTGEALGARWSEIDRTKELWVIPADRMKGGKEHIVPLTKPVLALLDVLPREAGNPFVFIGGRTGAGLSETNALKSVLRSMHRTDLTVHGFRSTFRDWAAEETSFPSEVCEMALAHAVGNQTERAYKRTPMLVLRRNLLAQWATFCTGLIATGDNVEPIGGRR